MTFYLLKVGGGAEMADERCGFFGFGDEFIWIIVIILIICFLFGGFGCGYGYKD